MVRKPSGAVSMKGGNETVPLAAMVPGRPSATGAAFVEMSATIETRFASLAVAVMSGANARDDPASGAVIETAGASRSTVNVKLDDDTAPPISVTSTSSV